MSLCAQDCVFFVFPFALPRSFKIMPTLGCCFRSVLRLATFASVTLLCCSIELQLPPRAAIIADARLAFKYWALERPAFNVGPEFNCRECVMRAGELLQKWVCNVLSGVSQHKILSTYTLRKQIPIPKCIEPYTSAHLYARRRIIEKEPP